MKRELIVARLSRLIEERDVHNEVECGKLLANPEAASVLLPLGTPMVLVDTELRTSSGDVDLIVCADESVAGGETCRRLYVWELKAPQLPLFRVETKGRASPTPSFYSAENQLIHYHAQLAGNEEDRRKFKICSADDVRIGGIIIGTSRTWVVRKKNFPQDRANRLAGTARDIRDRTLYRPAALRLMTWSMVLNNLQAVTASHRRFRKPSKAGIPLSAGPDVDEGIVGDA